MAACKDCKSFFPIEEKFPDYVEGKGDCVREQVDEKGKYVSSKPVMGDMENCPAFERK